MAVSSELRRFVRAPYDEVTVGEVMHEGVISCTPEAPIRHAARLMAHHRVHAVVVLGDDEEGGLWGVISDSNVVDAIARGDLDRCATGAIAQTPVVAIARSDSILRAADLMREHGVTHLLVTVRDRPAGVVSTLDLVRAAAGGAGSPPADE